MRTALCPGAVALCAPRRRAAPAARRRSGAERVAARRAAASLDGAARRGGGRAHHATGAEALQAQPPASKRRAPKVCKCGEKTADGKPKPDERTVADLVRRGWFKSEEATVALLTRGKGNGSRFPFETAEPAADWLEATLGPEPVKDRLCPAAKAVKGEPLLLARDEAMLQRKWDALTLPAERDGVGIALSTEQAREAVRKRPQLLGFSVEKYKTGWSMLLSTSGLGQTPEEAHECILRDPQILLKDDDNVVQRVALLKSLGYADARDMVLSNSRVLRYQDDTVRGNAAWWKQTGLDHVKLVTTLPTLLGVCSTEELQAKLDFLSRVAGMSNDDLNNAPSLFSRSLDGRLRARYFYALQKHRLARFGTINTMMQKTDAIFLAMMQGGTWRDRASEAEVARYQKLATSAKFVAWRERQEARILRSRS